MNTSRDICADVCTDVCADVFAYGPAGYRDLMAQLGQPAYRAQQLAGWLWTHGAADYDEMSNLPAVLREQLAEVAVLRRGNVLVRQESTDGTRKYLVQFADGVAVECVGIPDEPGTLPTQQRSPKHLTVCVSSQAGCALGCSFCATGRAGFTRDLLPGEIAEQIRLVAADFGVRAGNVVVMGQGEPFLNFDAVVEGLRIANGSDSQGGLGIGARHITVSTAGIVNGIRRFSALPEQFTLAVSLHSAVQATRDRLMPGVSGQPLSALADALIDYREQSGRRASLEYAVVSGVNDTPAEVDALCDFARRVHAHVNLIGINPIDRGCTGSGGGASAAPDIHATPAMQGAPGAPATTPTPAQRTTDAALRSVAATLRRSGIEVSIRRSRGADIDAACGQLAGRGRYGRPGADI
ncbi:MAG: 23S rRNA (adenine(2503)-C(2))-methyltransferase RlmN [Actinomycetes bacterium]|nr:23S rRNA (adenine(2503)-C(2))-methyltransferase RlmN [Actinomycetes bacterium]